MVDLSMCAHEDAALTTNPAYGKGGGREGGEQHEIVGMSPGTDHPIITTTVDETYETMSLSVAQDVGVYSQERGGRGCV